MTPIGPPFRTWPALLILLLALIGPRAAGAAQVSLVDMEKEENPGRTKMTLRFNQLPEFEVTRSGQRVDLLLSDTRVAAKLRRLPEDETVIKILLAQKYKDLLTSFLLRRPPLQLHAESFRSPARIVLDLTWQGDASSRPGVVFRIPDMPPRKAGKRAREHARSSPWQGRWRAFFSEYRRDWELQLPLNYSLPPLPLARGAADSPLGALHEMRAAGRWQGLPEAAQQFAGLSAAEQAERDLLVAEAYLRQGKPALALARLEHLAPLAAESPLPVGYLTASAQAREGRPYLALLTLQENDDEPSADDPLEPLRRLFEAELALATGQPAVALSALDAVQSWPQSLQESADLRRADALAGLERPAEALELYAELKEVAGLLRSHPFSCARAAQIAFRQENFPLAAELFHLLAGREDAAETAQDALLLFAAGAASYLAGDHEWGTIELQKTTLEFPGTEGSDRARLLLIDDLLLGGGNLELAQAATDYHQLSRSAVSRQVRDEAAFKEALSLYLLQDHAGSVRQLMSFRRKSSSSPLRREVDLLLLEQLPRVVQQLLDAEDALQAVVLVEQNRDLLLRGDLAGDFLHALAGAFTRLGLYPRATRVLLYLFDRGGEAQRRQLYLPLARSYLKQQRYPEASEYAERYLRQYPQGDDAAPLFQVLLDALEEQELREELHSWLERDDRPRSAALEVRAAWFYWRQERTEEAIASLEGARRLDGELAVKEMALLAEGLYQLGRNQEAQKIYRQLHSDAEFAAQAIYRSAQLRLRQQDRSGALNLLARLVDEQGNSPWSKLAQDLLVQERNREF